ncbi:YqgE/AlgH family protein [Notoacmeibacter ruber]|uniref:UPF0301 protein D8780_03815 n=1 Tax=Notoacmeibacter ruber TaxID=2670375 RepID=A0A3L7JAK0_9HYPH|nr:YqgE/AlgH family protein [Notoacmeibacter ruber]RLQ87464.1 YqgE/AlgH family protein [Notoacmeibacter ruber]
MSEFLEGKFLIAMPDMADERFSRTVILVCAHSEEGAMGIVINRAQEIGFADLISQIGLIDDDEAIHLPAEARKMIVRDGGPVDRSRGFVLHSDDYTLSSSLDVSGGLRLTATVDVLRAISDGSGPEKAIMALGYAGWGAGQLEGEIAQNGWLVADAPSELIFDRPLEEIWPGALGLLGIDPVNLSAVAGNA